MKRLDSNFTSRGIECAGWLYLPARAQKPPVVVMAHGIAAQRDFRLPAYAARFVELGLAVYLFDYRNFGGSGGEPRNLVSHRRHLRDWEAAIAHVRSLPELDGTRIALWGSSYGGGHALVTAARTRGIAAVVAQVPFVDSIATMRLFPLGYIVKGLMHGLADVLSSGLMRRPHCIPVVGDPDEFALMNTPDSLAGYLALVPKGSDWRNECPARVMLSLPFYRPIRHARRIKCPALIACALRDSLIPEHAVRALASRIENVRLLALQAGHFDVYYGRLFEELVAAEGEFLRAALKP